MMSSGRMEVPGSDEGMIGPGPSSVFTDGGRSYLMYHYYDAFGDGDPRVGAGAPAGLDVVRLPVAQLLARD